MRDWRLTQAATVEDTPERRVGFPVRRGNFSWQSQPRDIALLCRQMVVTMKSDRRIQSMLTQAKWRGAQMNFQTGAEVAGRWRVLDVMQGGMAVVYKDYDRHPDFREILAAKTLPDEAYENTPELRALFRKEIHTWISIGWHSNIVEAKFVEEVHGIPVLFMEYAPGGSLSDALALNKGRFDGQRTLLTVKAICDGMAHANRHGVPVHRDLKPQNILLGADGTPKVADFGLARFRPGLLASERVGAASRLEATTAGWVAGTAPYMAPEQFSDAASVDCRADIYAVGVILFQMTRGELPYPGSSWNELQAKHEKASVPWMLGTPSPIKEIIVRCLEKNARNRPQSFEELGLEVAAAYRKLTGADLPTAAPRADADFRRLCNQGGSLSTLGAHREAIEVLEKAIRLNRRDWKSWSNKGSSEQQLGDFQAASRSFERAAQLAPSSWEPLLNLAMAQKGGGQADRAVSTLDRALLLAPNEAAIWAERGRQFRDAGDMREAERAFRHALEIDGASVPCMLALGLLYQQLGNLAGAIAVCGRILKLNPGHIDALVLMSQAVVASGDQERAMEFIRRAIALEPKTPGPRLAIADMFVRIGRPRDAIAQYQAALQFQPDEAQTWMNLGVAFGETGEISNARDAFSKALSMGRSEAADAVRFCNQLLARDGGR